MNKYVQECIGFEEDALLGGTEFPTELRNVNVGASATIERGDLLCGNSMSSVFAPVGSASDASKILLIANEDFVADSLNAVTSAYASGKFNRSEINVAGGSIGDFEAEMRKQNLHLTEVI